MKLKLNCLLSITILIAGCTSTRADENDIYNIVFSKASKYYDELEIQSITLYQPLDTKTIDNFKQRLLEMGIDQQINYESINDYNNKKANVDITEFIAGNHYVSSTDSKYKVSRIGFNSTFTAAVIYEDDNRIPLAGHGQFIFCKKLSGKWQFDFRILIWVS